MPEKSVLRPPTEVLTRGFDPRLSVGSARPAVFRSSTYVFSSPEAAERAFDIMAGRAKPEPGEHVDLVYSRFIIPTPKFWRTRSCRSKQARRPRWCSTPEWPRS